MTPEEERWRQEDWVADMQQSLGTPGEWPQLKPEVRALIWPGVEACYNSLGPEEQLYCLTDGVTVITATLQPGEALCMTCGEIHLTENEHLCPGYYTPLPPDPDEPCTICRLGGGLRGLSEWQGQRLCTWCLELEQLKPVPAGMERVTPNGVLARKAAAVVSTKSGRSSVGLLAFPIGFWLYTIIVHAVQSQWLAITVQTVSAAFLAWLLFGRSRVASDIVSGIITVWRMVRHPRKGKR